MGNPAETKVVVAGAPKSGGRRRVLTGAVGATSVLMTIGSRPALGGGCMSFATVSVNAASSNTQQAKCATMMGGGYNCDDWVAKTDSWPPPYQAV
jgi:hypothetical protein